MTNHTNHVNESGEAPILVLGGTGKTGRRVVDRLHQRGRSVRAGSRSGQPPFDWGDPSTWKLVLEGVESAYITYYPDLAFPGAAETIAALAEQAVAGGTRRLVLLSGRNEEEAVPSEDAVRNSGAEWTILRSSWFAQNFSEHFLLEPVLSGVIALPAGDVAEPFVDVDDIADVAMAALTQDGHHAKTYDLTGPRLLTFADAAAELSRATGRHIRYLPVTPEEYATAAVADGVPPEEVGPLTDLFTRVLDGRNAQMTDGVESVLGRQPRHFADYARRAAAAGAWDPA